MYRMLAILTFLIISLLFTACSRAKVDNSGTQSHLNVLRVDVGSEPPSLDPTLSEDFNSQRIMFDLFAGLVDFDQQNKIIPGLAQSWEITPDGKTYTFHLRNGLKFSDGSALTAHDFVFSWQRLIDPKTGSAYNFILDNVVNGKAILNGEMLPSSLGIAAPDDTTFIVNLVVPDSSFLEKNTLSNLFVVSQNNVKKFGSKWVAPENMVTSGAYKLKSHIVNGYVLVEKNPYFYAANDVHIQQVKYFPYVDTNTALSSYASGDLDITFHAPIDQQEKLKADYHDQLHTVLQERLEFYEFNMKLPEFANNIKLRQALSMAIDRETMVNDVLKGGRKSVYSVVTPTIEDGKYADVKYDWSAWPKEKRIAEAKRLYAEAGYGPNNPLNVKISYNTDDMYKKISLTIAAMWKDYLGVNVSLANEEWKQFLQTRHKAAYQVARGGWSADYNSVETYVQQYTCNNPQNDSKLCDPKIDALVIQANGESNAARRAELYKQAIKLIQDSYAVIPLFQNSYIRLVKPYVENYNIEHNYLDYVQTKWLKITN